MKFSLGHPVSATLILNFQIMHTEIRFRMTVFVTVLKWVPLAILPFQEVKSVFEIFAFLEAALLSRFAFMIEARPTIS